MYERILIPMDGSEFAEIVLPYARALALTFDSTIYVLGVCAEQKHPFSRLFTDYLENIAHRLKHIGVKTNAVVRYGKASTEIVEFTKKNNCDLVIMATHGRTGEASMGHVAESVVRGIDKPLLLVPKKLEISNQNYTQIFKRILVPLDGSRNCEAALPLATELVQRTNARLYVLHIMLATSSITGGMDYAVKLQYQLMETLRKQAREYLNTIAAELDKASIDIKYDLVTGLPATTILDYAKHNSIDLIAMTTHGRTGVGRFVLGSVANKVIHASNVPIFIIRSSLDD